MLAVVYKQLLTKGTRVVCVYRAAASGSERHLVLLYPV